VAAVIFSSFTSTFTVIFYGFVTVDVFCFFFVISFFCSFVIAYILRRIIEKTGKESILVLILIIKIGASLFILPISTLMEVLASNKPMFSMRSLC